MTQKLKLLIVDDSFIIRQAIKKYLKKYNLEVVGTAENGKIETPKQNIEAFIHLIKTYEKRYRHDFVILPYSEINTSVYHIDTEFKENFIADYTSFQGIQAW